MKLFGLGRSPRTFEFKCADCDEIHRGSPSFSYRAPGYALSVPEAEQEQRVQLTDDLCRVLPADGEDTTFYFIRTILEIPIHGCEEPFGWGVWVTQSEESFERYYDTYDQDQSEDSSFGWLPNTLPGYHDTPVNGEAGASFPCDVQWAEPGKRPEVFLHEVDHPLYIDQTEGISWERAIELARIAMHGHSPS